MIIVSLDKTGTMRPVVMLRVLRVTEDWPRLLTLTELCPPELSRQQGHAAPRDNRASVNCVTASIFC